MTRWPDLNYRLLYVEDLDENDPRRTSGGAVVLKSAQYRDFRVTCANYDNAVGVIRGVQLMYSPPYAAHDGPCPLRFYDVDKDAFVCAQCGRDMYGEKGSIR